jgi:nucleoid DNA-binding protein
MLGFGQMKKSDLARELARRNGVSTADAADQLDYAVSRIIRTLKSGRPARLPGLGTILPGRQWTFRRDPK